MGYPEWLIAIWISAHYKWDNLDNGKLSVLVGHSGQCPLEMVQPEWLLTIQISAH